MSSQATTSQGTDLSDHVRRVLRQIWDPIGLGAELPEDEYDSYAPGLVALVRDLTAFEAKIAAHLCRIEAEMMGLSPKPARATRAARALLGLREVCTRHSAALVTQVVSPDGLHCLWVLQRPDGFCIYEHAMLRHEDDENGAWSWWADAGQGRSGLFASAEAAEHDARGSIGWMR
jgi:hypothetical protein